MRNKNYFWKSLLPLITIFIFKLLADGCMLGISILKDVKAGGFDLNTILNFISDGNPYATETNFIYGCICVLFFGIWYYRIFVRPFKKKTRKIPGGFSFHTIVACIFIGLGLHYLTDLVHRLLNQFFPAVTEGYSAAIQSLGVSDLTPIVIIYTILLSPIFEEFVFRGLIYRYARHAFPFWLANFWQALFFGLIHMNLTQGIYCFICGLILGWIARKGRGIRYSIPVHIIFNILGLWFSGFVTFTQAFNYYLMTGLGMALLIFGMWLFSSDFKGVVISVEEQEQKERDAEEKYDAHWKRFL